MVGNRLPHLSFSLSRPKVDADSAAKVLKAVNMVPSAGEFIYAK